MKYFPVIKKTASIGIFHTEGEQWARCPLVAGAGMAALCTPAAAFSLPFLRQTRFVFFRSNFTIKFIEGQGKIGDSETGNLETNLLNSMGRFSSCSFVSAHFKGNNQTNPHPDVVFLPFFSALWRGRQLSVWQWHLRPQETAV